MFGPEYFHQVGWIGDGFLLALDEADLEEVAVEWEALDAASRAQWAEDGRQPWQFDGARDVLRDGERITFNDLVEERLGLRPLYEAEANEALGEDRYDAARRLSEALKGAAVESGFGDLHNAIERFVDDLEDEDLGIGLFSDLGTRIV
jgi:hypothetical protein